MTIESVIADNTAAVTELTRVLKLQSAPALPGTPVNATPAEKPKKQSAKAAAAETTGGTAPSAKTVADAVTALAAKSRDAAVGVLKEFGVGRASELKPEQYTAALAAFAAADAKLAAPAPANTGSLV